MKRSLLLTAALTLLPLFAGAQSFDAAAEAYNAGDYLGAALKYEEQIKSQPAGYQNPYLYYNLANSYFKAGDPDKAVVNYYRAFNLLPRDKDIRSNLTFALDSTGQRLVPEGVPQTAFNIYYYLSVTELKGMLWAGVWFFALCLCVYAFTAGRGAARAGLIFAGVFLALCALWYFARLPAASAVMAVSAAARLEVRSGPGENFPVSLSLPRAYLVKITDAKGDWAEIEINPGNATGWVLKKQIEEI
jgi:tetratricopeptide (TPR) repeat protein